MPNSQTSQTYPTHPQDPTLRTQRVEPPQVLKVRRWLQDGCADPHTPLDRRLKRVRQLIRDEALEVDVLLYVMPSFVPEALRWVAGMVLDDPKTARLVLNQIWQPPTSGEMRRSSRG